VDGDIVPGWNGERLDVEGGRDIAVGSGEDDQGFAAGEGLPVTIGAGEVAFDETVRALVFDDQWEVGGNERRCDFWVRLRAKEDGEGVRSHGFDEDGAICDLVEFG
jgi:hypothetical protein